MAQHDGVIDNGPGLAVRTDMNAAVQALMTMNSGPLEPTTKYPGQFWLDTTVTPNGQLKQRNLANNAWVTPLFVLGPTVNWYVKTTGGTESFAWYKNDTGAPGGANQSAIMNLTGSGTLSAVNFSATGSTFFSTTNSVILTPTGAGSVLLRPNGGGSTTGQTTIDAAGNLTVAAQVIGGTGYRNRSGSGGVYTASLFNMYYNAGPVALFIDTTNLGNITLSSDYRIKKDVAPLTSTWDKVKALRPISYTQAEFHPPAQAAADAEAGKDYEPMYPGDDIERWGFIAHELQEGLLPTAANGVKDAPDEIQSLNLAPIVAALTKALQEAMARIEALEAA